ncbi:hypothetical protein [Olivibacter sp. XZL3]|uniref:hypothetical protein n=1 Tax=Olivibacter sp. XZL3 TaxID=1735116 RepID=UPI001065B6D9|nr:hypothetical protein [Olivibacter sp. XZL3]
MEAITHYYKAAFDTGNMLFLLNLIILVLGIFFLSIKKTPFSFGFILVIVFCSLSFMVIAMRFYQDALKGIDKDQKDVALYETEIKKSYQFRKESRTRVAVEMSVVLVALFLLLRAKPESKKQGVSIALIICGTLMFIFDIYISSHLSDHIADLKIRKHNAEMKENLNTSLIQRQIQPYGRGASDSHTLRINDALLSA